MREPGVAQILEDFINDLNDANFGGYSDWRLPTVKELATLIKYSIASPGPTIDTVYFPDTYQSEYWSSTTYALYNDWAWGVTFYYGYDSNYYRKSESHYVRAVRGGGQSGAFTDNGNGTITDTATGLMWQKGSSSSDHTWEEALSYCERLNLGGYTDWRLPTSQ